MPNVVTTVPYVLNALVQLARNTYGDDLVVFDGAPDTDAPPDGYLSIGFTRDDEEGAVDGGTTDEGNNTAAEVYAVHCLLSVTSGNTEPGAVAAVRARAYGLWGVLATAVRADPTLGGVLGNFGRAAVTQWSWVYGPTDTGVVCDVAFDVSVAADYLGAT